MNEDQKKLKKILTNFLVDFCLHCNKHRQVNADWSSEECYSNWTLADIGNYCESWIEAWFQSGLEK